MIKTVYTCDHCGVVVHDGMSMFEITQDIVNAACALRHELARLDNAEPGKP